MKVFFPPVHGHVQYCLHPEAAASAMTRRAARRGQEERASGNSRA